MSLASAFSDWHNCYLRFTSHKNKQNKKDFWKESRQLYNLIVVHKCNLLSDKFAKTESEDLGFLQTARQIGSELKDLNLLIADYAISTDKLPGLFNLQTHYGDTSIGLIAIAILGESEKIKKAKKKA